MNLGQAKLILIIVFTGLNLFLAYYLFWPDFGRLTRVAITVEDLKMTQAVLNENNYFLEASFNRAVQTSDFLTVTPSAELQQHILMHFIAEGAQINYNDNTIYFNCEGERAVVYSNGLIQIFYEPGLEINTNSSLVSEQEIRSNIESILLEKAVMPEGFSYDYIEENENGKVNLFYYQILNEMPVFAGQMKVVLKEQKIVSVDIYWLDMVERIPSREMEVISATDALNNFVTEMGPSPEPKHIKEVTLGYFSGEYEAEKWEIPPVWRIVLDDHTHYFINAFTGNLEQEGIIPDQLQ
ncbi:MAG: two-component system regulatory protein YycI [Bacillota bacterium]|nr:two-component system regulatory protein YycI [Bacillota bacterium]